MRNLHSVRLVRSNFSRFEIPLLSPAESASARTGISRLIIYQPDFRRNYAFQRRAALSESEFADRSPAAGQCAAFVAVKPKELAALRRNSTPARAKRVQSQADLARELWRWVVLVSTCRFPPWTTPRAAHALSGAGQSAPPLFFGRNRGEKPESARPRDQFGEPLDVPVQRRIKSGRNRKPVSHRRSLRLFALPGCRLGPRAFAVRFAG